MCWNEAKRWLFWFTDDYASENSNLRWFGFSDKGKNHESATEYSRMLENKRCTKTHDVFIMMKKWYKFEDRDKKNTFVICFFLTHLLQSSLISMRFIMMMCWIFQWKVISSIYFEFGYFYSNYYYSVLK